MILMQLAACTIDGINIHFETGTIKEGGKTKFSESLLLQVDLKFSLGFQTMYLRESRPTPCVQLTCFLNTLSIYFIISAVRGMHGQLWKNWNRCSHY